MVVNLPGSAGSACQRTTILGTFTTQRTEPLRTSNDYGACESARSRRTVSTRAIEPAMQPRSPSWNKGENFLTRGKLKPKISNPLLAIDVQWFQARFAVVGRTFVFRWQKQSLICLRSDKCPNNRADARISS